MKEKIVKNITVYTILPDAENLEIISAYLWELEPAGIEEVDSGLRLYFDAEQDPGKESVEKALEELKTAGQLNDYQVMTQVFANRNWNEEWEKNISVIRVSDDMVIKPTFKEYTPEGNELILTIDPKMSFGTGEHQTTKLMLLALKKYIRGGEKILDAGTGSGILAIGAVKLGAASAIAFDNDDWCYDNGIENCRLNDVSDKVEIRTCELDDIPQTEFDLILANIQKNILAQIVEGLSSRTKTGGILLLSGLLGDDVEEVTGIYTQHGFTLLEVTEMQEWRMIALRRN
ncbi:MAG: 50S ribosomal protein L11 methyltransferase [Ignavibacteriaceae bacterium]|nr:50S ribosomal protein L11 methyltransferase [Ignavibacteriaceae bacterium]